MGTPPDQHEMECRATYPSGAQEWFCPACQRHFVVRWTPGVQRLVLAAGDEDAAHSGRNGEVRLSGEAAVRPFATHAERAWRRWLHENGIDWDGPA